MNSRTVITPAAGPAQAGGRTAVSGRIGMFAPSGLLEQGPETARAFLAQAGQEGIDHICCGDHVSFAGMGFDGLVQATALAMLHPTLPVHTGVYLLPLRHPVLVARQLADIARLAPGRLIFGVGIGGEDRHEVAICGVDPATRGLRMDECLAVLRQLLNATPGTFHGKFFDLDNAIIAPAPAVAIPIIIGGRSDAAIRGAGRLGDGWLGIWNSPRRFADAVEMAAKRGRPDRPALPTGPSRDAGMVRAGRLQGGGSSLPGAGDGGLLPAPVRAVRALLPLRHRRRRRRVPRALLAAGCTEFNFIPQSPDHDVSIAGTAAVKGLLA